MTNKSESRSEFCEDENSRTHHLKGTLVSETNPESKQTGPYIRIFDYRLKQSMITAWPSELDKLPERIKITCQENSRTVCLETKDLLNSYFLEKDKALRSESNGANIFLSVPKKDERLFREQLREMGCNQVDIFPIIMDLEAAAEQLEETSDYKTVYETLTGNNRDLLLDFVAFYDLEKNVWSRFYLDNQETIFGSLAAGHEEYKNQFVIRLQNDYGWTDSMVCRVLVAIGKNTDRKWLAEVAEVSDKATEDRINELQGEALNDPKEIRQITADAIDRNPEIRNKLKELKSDIRSKKGILNLISVMREVLEAA